MTLKAGKVYKSENKQTNKQSQKGLAYDKKNKPLSTLIKESFFSFTSSLPVKGNVFLKFPLSRSALTPKGPGKGEEGNYGHKIKVTLGPNLLSLR